jgi:hypothetical protein
MNNTEEVPQTSDVPSKRAVKLNMLEPSGLKLLGTRNPVTLILSCSAASIKFILWVVFKRR